MSICANCGVELEAAMQRCPLCGTPTGAAPGNSPKIQQLKGVTNLKISGILKPREKSLLQRIVWQVTSILLFSAIIATLIIDLAEHKRITWSIYPVTVSMIIFSYASLFAFWHAKKIYQILAGLLISSILFVLLDLLLPQSDWLLRLGLPLLGAVNVIAIILIASINLIKHRGLNVMAYTCVALALLCISIESIISFYNGNIVLRWSVIVSACLLPVTMALLFMHHRIKRNPEMEKIFHT